MQNLFFGDSHSTCENPESVEPVLHEVTVCCSLLFIKVP